LGNYIGSFILDFAAECGMEQPTHEQVKHIRDAQAERREIISFLPLQPGFNSINCALQTKLPFINRTGM
ncbi:MAG: hypothetical protein ACOVQX_00055, partial [Legionella sp.]